MSDYNKSLYAINKFSNNIVYRFGDEIKEITMEDYLNENPSKTEADFIELKKISDEMFHNEDLSNTYYRKKKLSIHDMNEDKIAINDTPLENIIKKEDISRVNASVNMLLDDKKLTEIQKRRFIMHFYENKSLREIAKIEGVHHNPVHRSIRFAIKKLKTFFNE